MPKVCEDMFYVGTSLGQGITGSYFLQPLLLAGFAAWATYNVRKAKHLLNNAYGPQNPTYLLLPIYRYVMWILCPIILIANILQMVIKVKLIQYDNNIGNSIGIGITYALRAIAFEVVSFSFMSAGAGKRTYLRSFAMAGLWALVTFGLKTASYYHVQRNPTVSLVLEFVWGGLLCLFYIVLAILPNNRLIARRPAVRLYSAFWAIAYVVFLTSTGLREPNLKEAYCVQIGYFYLFVLLWPYFVYKCFMDDSSYWQGAANVSVAANSIASVIQGGLNQTLAMDLVKADTFDVEFINFAALTIDQAPKQPKRKPDDIIAEEEAYVRDGDDMEMKLKSDNHFIIESGSMAKVYRGKYRQDPIAIKLIYAPELTTELIRNLFGEAAIMSALRFSHVTGVKGVCVMPPAVSLVMELCQGSLHDLLHKPCVYDALFMYEQRLNRARRLRYGLPVTPYYSLSIQPHQNDTEYLSLARMDPVESKRLISSYLENLIPEHEEQLNAGLPPTYSQFTAMPILPPLPIDVQLRLAIDVVTGLAFMHTQRQPVMHLDVKSGNFLLGRDGVVKVADLELATRLPSQDAVLAPYLKEEKYHRCTEECMALIDAADCGLDEHNGPLDLIGAGDLDDLAEEEEESTEGFVLTLPPLGKKSADATPSPSTPVLTTDHSPPDQTNTDRTTSPPVSPGHVVEERHHISFVQDGQGTAIKHRRFSNLVNKDPDNVDAIMADLEGSDGDHAELDDLVLELDDNIDDDIVRYAENSYTDSPTSRSRAQARGNSRSRRDQSVERSDALVPDLAIVPNLALNMSSDTLSPAPELGHLSIEIHDSSAASSPELKRRRKDSNKSSQSKNRNSLAVGLQTPVVPDQNATTAATHPSSLNNNQSHQQLPVADDKGVAIPGYPTSLGYPVLLPVKAMKPVICPQRFSFHFRPPTNENIYTYETYPFYRISDRRATVLNPGANRVNINQDVASPLVGALSDPAKLTLSHSTNFPKMLNAVHQDEQNQQMNYLQANFQHLAAFTQPNRYHRPPLGYDKPEKHKRILQRQRRKQQPFTSRQRQQQREQNAMQEKARQEELQLVQRATTAFTSLEPESSTLRSATSSVPRDDSSIGTPQRSTSRVGRGRLTASENVDLNIRERSISRYRGQSRERDRTLYRYVDGVDTSNQSTITTRANTRIQVHSGTSSAGGAAPTPLTPTSSSGNIAIFRSASSTQQLNREREREREVELEGPRLSTLAESASPPPGLEQLQLPKDDQPSPIAESPTHTTTTVMIASNDDDHSPTSPIGSSNSEPLPPPGSLPTLVVNYSSVQGKPDDQLVTPPPKDAPEIPLTHYASAWAYTAHTTQASANNLSRYTSEHEINKVREFWIDVCDQSVPLPRQHLGWGLKVAYGQIAHEVLYNITQNFNKMVQYERHEQAKKLNQETRLNRQDSVHDELASPHPFGSLATPRGRGRGSSSARIFFSGPEKDKLTESKLTSFPSNTPSLLSANSTSTHNNTNATNSDTVIASIPANHDDQVDPEFNAPETLNSRPTQQPSNRSQKQSCFSCLESNNNPSDSRPTESPQFSTPTSPNPEEVDVPIDATASSISNATNPPLVPAASSSTMTTNSNDSQKESLPTLKNNQSPAQHPHGIELQPMMGVTSNVTNVASMGSAQSPLANLHPPGFHLFLTSHQSHSQSATALLRKQKELEQRKNMSWFQRMRAMWNQADLTNDENDLEREITVPQCLYWLAPEIIRHEPFGLAADVYSVACVLWEITTRQVPFREMEEIMEQEHRRETEERKMLARERKKQIDAGLTPTIEDPYRNYLTSPEEQLAKMIGYHHFRPTIPSHTDPAFSQIIRRCWHHDPSMRPSLVQVALELRLLYHHHGFARGDNDWYGIEQTMMEAEIQGINLEDLQLDIDNTGPQNIFKYPAGHPMAQQPSLVQPTLASTGSSTFATPSPHHAPSTPNTMMSHFAGIAATPATPTGPM